MKARSEDAGPGSDVTDRNVPRGNPVTTEDLVKAILSGRDSDSGQGIQARSFMDLLELGFSALNQVLRRDVTPEMLLARGGVDDLVNSIISRDSSSEDDNELINTPASRRDVASDGLGARGEYEDLLKILNTRELDFKRDLQARGSLLTGFLAWALHKLMSLPIRLRDLTSDGLVGRNAIDDILATREPSSKQQTQARDSESATTLLHALLQSRDVSTRTSGLSTADLLRIIASRALEDLD